MNGKCPFKPPFEAQPQNKNAQQQQQQQKKQHNATLSNARTQQGLGDVIVARSDLSLLRQLVGVVQ